MVSLQGFRGLREGAIGGAGGAGRPQPWRTQRKNGDFHGKKLGKHGDNIWFHGDLGDEIGVLWLEMIFKNQLCWVTFWVL